MKLIFNTTVRLAFLSALLLLLPTTSVRAQSARIQLTRLDHLAAKASETVDVNIDERLIQLTAKFLSDPDNADVKKLVNGLKGIYVKSFEFETEGQYTSTDVEAIRSQLTSPAWSRVVNVNSKKEGSVEVYLLLNGDRIGGLALLSIDPKEFTVVNIVGPVDLEKLSKLEGNFGIPDLGLEPVKPKKNER